MSAPKMGHETTEHRPLTLVRPCILDLTFSADPYFLHNKKQGQGMVIVSYQNVRKISRPSEPAQILFAL